VSPFFYEQKLEWDFFPTIRLVKKVCTKRKKWNFFLEGKYSSCEGFTW